MISETTILLTSIILFLPLIKSHDSQHYNSLIYTKCSNQTQTLSPHNSLSSFFQQLIPQSSHSNFYKTTAGGGAQTGISGLYQCRGNLDKHQCYNCINTLPQHLTCKQAVAARIELNGCYLKYETDEFVEETSRKHELLHETCSEEKAEELGFVEVRDAAFLEMEEGMGEEKGFYHYEKDYGNVNVIGECERDVMGCDCSECLGFAAEIARMDCGSSVWGKVYLDNCFLSYALKLYQEEKRSDTGKMVAIALGAVASLVAAFIFLTCMKSRFNKDDLSIQMMSRQFNG
ncbi:plasmodesmata-located protein 3-like [Euphorbia lathyris]|uniref:plasmodesmata-located protein 3-like n=1 Tax=Euphorbia lathyris TaxID=212925 RepID=UPI0033139DA3